MIQQDETFWKDPKKVPNPKIIWSPYGCPMSDFYFRIRNFDLKWKSLILFDSAIYLQLDAIRRLVTVFKMIFTASYPKSVKPLLGKTDQTTQSKQENYKFVPIYFPGKWLKNASRTIQGMKFNQFSFSNLDRSFGQYEWSSVTGCSNIGLYKST